MTTPEVLEGPATSGQSIEGGSRLASVLLDGVVVQQRTDVSDHGGILQGGNLAERQGHCQSGRRYLL